MSMVCFFAHSEQSLKGLRSPCLIVFVDLNVFSPGRGRIRIYSVLGDHRPSSNKKSFPVHRPGELKRAYWNIFFPVFKNIFFFYLSPCTF